MPPADGIQNGIIESLRIYTDSAHAGGFQRIQLFRRNGIRSARLNRIFAQGGKIKIVFYGA